MQGSYYLPPRLLTFWLPKPCPNQHQQSQQGSRERVVLGYGPEKKDGVPTYEIPGVPHPTPASTNLWDDRQVKIWKICAKKEKKLVKIK